MSEKSLYTARSSGCSIPEFPNRLDELILFNALIRTTVLGAGSWTSWWGRLIQNLEHKEHFDHLLPGRCSQWILEKNSARGPLPRRLLFRCAGCSRV